MLSASRLDIVVKFLLFRSLLSGIDDGVRDLYERHISRRTGGFEDRKQSSLDYLIAAEHLLESLQARGFDPAFPVRIGLNNGLPLDGAHRIAAALALGIDVPIEPVPDRSGGVWDFEWFTSRGFARDDLDTLVRTYAGLTARGVAFIFWGPTRPHWDALSAMLSAHTSVVGWTDVALDPADVQTVVEDVYAFRLGPLKRSRIADKGRALSESAAVMRVSLVDAPAAIRDLEAFATNLKHQLRAIGGQGEHDFWTTVHATDSVEEARHIVDLFFNRNYRRTLALRRGVATRPAFLAWLEQYRQVLVSHRIPLDDACIVGSSVLEAVGVRDSTDIDCIVGSREPRFHAGVVRLGEGVDLVTRGYHRRAGGGAMFADADVIANPLLHFRMRGLKFANPEIVIDRKRLNRRPKDAADVALWDARMSAPPAPAPTRTAVLWTGTPMDVVRQAEIARLREAHAQRGIALVVAGVPAVPALVAWPCIEAPPPVDSLPVDLFIDTDPCETLKQCGIAAAALLDAEAVASGPASAPGHAFRRVRGFAWVARWMRAWVDVVRPTEVIIDTEGPCAIVLRALTGSCESTTIDTRRIGDACCNATEQVRIVAHLSRQRP